MKSTLLFISWFFLFLTPSKIFAQLDEKSPDIEGLFTFDALNFFSRESTNSRVDIYIDVPFQKVEFKKVKSDESKNGMDYSSEIDFTVTVTRKNGEAAFTNVYKEVIRTAKTDINYLSRNSQIITKNIFLEPGDYMIKISSREATSKKYFELQKALYVKDFRALPVSISDVMIVSKVSDVQGKKYITPLASRNAANLDTMFLFFFVYLNNSAVNLKVQCKIFNSKHDEVFSLTQLSDPMTDLGFENQFILTVPTVKFSNDIYTTEILASTTDNSVTGISQFEFKIAGFPVSLDDIDLAIDQLQYIATDKELKKIRRGKTPADKQRRFIEFWKSKDPTPGTAKNEIMNEYYRRIEFANKTYSTQFTPGWKADMGMVYIIFGTPNNIERHPYESGTKPYEVWDYYELNREFVFIDESGFGDYHLITPIWDTFRYKN